MFVEKNFDGSVNTVSFNPETFKQAACSDTWYERGRVRNGYQCPNFYTVDAVWVSPAANTRGALAYGKVLLFFYDVPEQPYTFEEAMTQAQVQKSPEFLHLDIEGASPNWFVRHRRDVKYEVSVIAGNGKLWAGNDKDVDDKALFLLNTWKNRPNPPENFTPWVTLRNRN